MQTRKLLSSVVTSLVSTAACAQLSAPTTSAQIAAPFSMTIGKTTCDEAARLLKSVPAKASTDSTYVRVSATDPSELYAGATRIEAICTSLEAPIHNVRMEVHKGVGLDENFRFAAESLSTKYGKAAGHITETDAEVVFVAVNGEIHLAGRSGETTFSINYLTREWADRLREIDDAQRKRIERMKAEQSTRL